MKTDLICGNSMGRLNGTFKYRNPKEPEKDPATGFYTGGGVGEWEDGGRCQIDKAIPAKQIKGVDGQMYAYTWDLFILRPFHGETIKIGTEIEVTMEDGSTDAFTTLGVDNQNRRYIEVWG